ncbi:MAG: hypothetical protein JWM84_4027 [Nocardioides sp.]|nr:hypothetical protein [Nocardioides sp.]
MPPIRLGYKTDADVVKTEGKNRISRDEVVLATGAPALRPGAILVRGLTGKYTQLAAAPAEGAILGVLLETTPALTADRRAVVLSRHAEVVLQALEWSASMDAAEQSAALAVLEAQHIVARVGV